jgi:hypothetical protein
MSGSGETPAPVAQPVTPASLIWLPTMDSNHDKQIQSLLCYRYTSRQGRAQSTDSGRTVNHLER